jgi:hypothetical protein
VSRSKSILSLILAVVGAAGMYEFGIARNHGLIKPLTEELFGFAFFAFVLWLIYWNIRSARR